MKILGKRFPIVMLSVALEINGMPDFRIQKAHEYTKRYSDMYLLDNQMLRLLWKILNTPSGWILKRFLVTSKLGMETNPGRDGFATPRIMVNETRWWSIDPLMVSCF